MSTPLWINYLTQFVVAVVATISFGITFHVPKRHYLAGGLTGAVGWMVYILCYDLLSVTAPVAVLIATLPLTLCARFFSSITRHRSRYFCCRASSRWCRGRASITPPITSCGMTARCF